MLMSYHLEKRWQKLFHSAFYRTNTLQPVKSKFAELTLTEIGTFSLEVSFLIAANFNSIFFKLKFQLEEFIEKFETEGPGSVGQEMDKGAKLMDVFSGLFQNFEEQRLELVNAEKLFDIPLADYTNFLKVKKDFEGMQTVSKSYQIRLFSAIYSFDLSVFPTFDLSLLFPLS